MDGHYLRMAREGRLFAILKQAVDFWVLDNYEAGHEAWSPAEHCFANNLCVLADREFKRAMWPHLA